MQPPFGSHDIFHHEFCGGVSSGEGVDGLDHLLVRCPLVLQILGSTVIDVVNPGNLVQTVDARVASSQAFLEMRPGSHELIAGPMKFHPRLAQPLLNVDACTPLHPPLSRSSPFWTSRRTGSTRVLAPLPSRSRRTTPSCPSRHIWARERVGLCDLR